ncbi:PHP domain-containing protein [Bacillus subtilis]|uniref:DNA-directed DNA polymerase n=1 Tax=Bacillus subtilis subsp. natto TaxID=86029 RepID=E9RJF6_BACNA|nr:PHP domain-containing protein [Bacillus subtilis]MDX6158408.1 PHP domain-containing protein [Bacillus subtilis]OAZ70453.1 DNA-directed DNA polymerase [Bacillus subtilis]QAW48192.1 DNA polymerase III subunit alpha [Bacillus subtilis]TWG49471.1 DNA polymerase-3 subunit alpha [Bacillus subtilis J23]BAJ77051.1 putative DNA polymerase [Bacillus subtilis subsp. natto]
MARLLRSINRSIEKYKKKPFLTHSHTDASNFRLRDAINKPEELIDYCHEIGLSGVVITDHETLSSHVKAHKYVEENKERLGDFKLGFGNEIYLVDKADTMEKKSLNQKISFHHFILIAKSQKGYEGLKKLSSKAWYNSFFYRGMERVPTYKDELMSLMQEYQGEIIACTACVGGELPQSLIAYHDDPTPENKKRVHDLIVWLKGVFGEDLYFELQPSKNRDQLVANEMMLKVSEAYNVKCIVSTDAHYLNKKYAPAHKIYLTASEGEREVDEFYATTYVMGYEELLEYFDEELLDVLVDNTNEIRSKLGSITFAQETKVPKAHIPKYEMNQLFVPHYMEYQYIRKYAESRYDIDRYYLHLIAEGMVAKKQELNKENLSRINTELDELYHITEKLGQPLSSYFVLSKDVVDLMWQVSLVGVSRGSACCFYLNYLLDIVQLNPMKFNLPHWRFLSKERPELPDIDLDSEGSKRHEIIQITKEHYGEENVLNMGTFTTEGTRSTVLTSCRGLGIDKDIAHNIANLIPTRKGGIWSLHECFYGNPKEGTKPAKEFCREVEKYEGLKEAMLSIEGLISGRGQHASGVIIFPDGYIKQNAMMKTTSGLPITQFDAEDSIYMGGLKLDYLSINALDRIRTALDLLLEHGKIEWQGSLRATYNKYFHPDVLEMESPKMFDLLFEGHVLNAFQFETAVGQQALTKINPRSFDELCAGNSLMRLSTDGEQPLDKYVRFKNNIQDWYEEMKTAGLNEEEIKILEEHLLDRYGICDTQEGLMLLAMDERIAGFSLTQANKFRKAVAKANQKLIEDQRIKFYEGGEKTGARKVFLDYVWNKELKPQFGYSFSLPHIAGYTMILMIEMNICHRYGAIYWKTACLSVNAGMIGETEKGTKYGAIAKAVGDMKGDILNPDINLSNKEFTPLEEENKILFGLKPIAGLGTDAIEKIIEHRPYKSFGDFFKKIVDPGLISEAKVVSLIKAGCFDSFYPNRRLLMIDFVKAITPKKEKLTMVQLPTIIHLADKQRFGTELEVYKFRNKLFGRNKVPMTREIEQEFMDFLQAYPYQVDYEFKDGKLCVDQKTFDKAYKEIIEPLRMWVTSPEAAEQFNKIKMKEFWAKHCQGTIEAWEMETLLFYSKKHELDYMPLHNYFNIANFNDLPSNPVITGYKKNRRGNDVPQYKIDVIAGTVVEKNKQKSLVHVLTQDAGVVTVRYSKGQFAHYDKKVVRVHGKEKEVLDPSWFERGSKLVLVGFRRGEEFVLRTTGTQFKHSTMKIKGYDSEKLYLQMAKVAE